MIKIALVVLLAFTAGAMAQPLPVLKPAGPGGSCPHGYTSSSSYCVPAQGAQDAIPRPLRAQPAFGRAFEVGFKELGTDDHR